METKMMSIYDFEGNAVELDCPVGEGYTYIVTVLSGDEVLSIWKGEEFIDEFDSSETRMSSLFDGMSIYTSFESLVNRTR